MEFVKLKPINRICPCCGNGNYMRIISGKNVGKLNVKCINCNSYYNYDELLKGDNRQDYQNLRECPFCGGKKLVRSVDGGILPSFIDADKQNEIFEKTPYVTTCELCCELCGAQVEDYAASNNLHDNLYEKAIKNCYEKWNRRARDGYTDVT